MIDVALALFQNFDWIDWTFFAIGCGCLCGLITLAIYYQTHDK